MGLLTITNLEDGQDAVANALNERFGKIVDVINGNIESQNLKNNAVTREKIAPQSVTSDKLSINKYIDENGWTVTDYGTTKEYDYTKIGVASINRQKWEAFEIPLPVGVTNVNDCFVGMGTYSDTSESLFTIMYSDSVDKLRIAHFNTHTTHDSVSSAYRIDINIKPKG